MVGAVRQLLVDDEGFTALVPASRVSTRKPDRVTSIYVTVQIVGTAPINAAARAYSPMVQVTAWAPLTIAGADPERLVWDAAAKAADVLAATTAQTWLNAGFNLRVTDGPVPLSDTARSEADPLVGAAIRAELRVHHT